jgi:hypothetical protein
MGQQHKSVLALLIEGPGSIPVSPELTKFVTGCAY